MSKNTNQIDGWLIIDKPLKMGSTNVVSKLKWSLSPNKIGHAGTLDPLATGVLPIALGKATRLIPFVMDGSKIYEFQITWGQETTTDDAEGTPTLISEKRPTRDEIMSVLPRFIGNVLQMPPAYSALKIDGKRAYDLARLGQDVMLKERPVHIEKLELLDFTTNTADFRVVCGKGTYVRSLGRDIGRALGCYGYITKLRRIACGPFSVLNAVPLSLFDDKNPTVCPLPLETALDDLPKLELPETETKRLCQGQRLSATAYKDYFSKPVSDGDIVCLISDGKLFGLIKIIGKTIQPYRMF